MGGIIRAARSFRLADTLEPVIQSHRLVVNQALVQKDFDSTQGYSIEHHQRYQLFFQLTRMTRDKGALAKDDRLDALAMAVAYWSKALAVETEKVVQRKREEMMQAELEMFSVLQVVIWIFFAPCCPPLST